MVDDKPENLIALEASLEGQNLNLVKANSGNEALSCVLEYDFALILLDVQMPEMDGYEVAKLMRGSEKTKTIPIIFVTAISQEQNNIFKGYSSGAVDILFKPYDPDILNSKVSVFVELYIQKIELKKSASDLQIANLRIKDTTSKMIQSEKLTALGELTAGMAHEMNQPLNIIKITCQSIIKDAKMKKIDLKEITEDLKEVVGQTDRLADIVIHMRSFAKGTMDKNAVEEYDISGVVENSLKLIGAQLINRSIQIKLELNKELPKVVGHPIRIEHALLNILSNARNALELSDKKERNILIKTFQSKDKKEVMVEIADNANGIPEDIEKKIFQPFFTDKNVLAPDGRPTKGVGLGLSVSNGIIEQQNGRIELDSKEGKGSTFRIVLPIRGKTSA